MINLYTYIGITLCLILSSPSINSLAPSLNSLSEQKVERSHLDVAALIEHASQLKTQGFASYQGSNGNIQFLLTNLENTEEIWQEISFIENEVNEKEQHTKARVYHKNHDVKRINNVEYAYINDLKVYHIDSGVSISQTATICQVNIETRFTNSSKKLIQYPSLEAFNMRRNSTCRS